MTTMIDLVCAMCCLQFSRELKQFTRQKKVSGESYVPVCSRKCASALQKQRGESKIINCSYCAAPVKRTKSELNASGNYFCNATCSALFHQRKLLIDSNKPCQFRIASKIITDQEFTDIIRKSESLTDVSNALGYSSLAANTKTIKKHIKRLNLSISHFLSRADQKKTIRIDRPIDEMFALNSGFGRDALKRAIDKHNLMPYKCSICGIVNWRDTRLSLHLDHINGNNKDNRLENLRLLCPNCHSQTDTYAGKKLTGTGRQYKDNFCVDCHSKIGIESIRCRMCNLKRVDSKGNERPRLSWEERIEWPEPEQVVAMILHHGNNFTQVGRKLGISDNAIRKFLRRNGIDPKSIRNKL